MPPGFAVVVSWKGNSSNAEVRITTEAMAAVAVLSKLNNDILGAAPVASLVTKLLETLKKSSEHPGRELCGDLKELDPVISGLRCRESATVNAILYHRRGVENQDTCSTCKTDG